MPTRAIADLAGERRDERDGSQDEQGDADATHVATRRRGAGLGNWRGRFRHGWPGHSTGPSRCDVNAPKVDYFNSRTQMFLKLNGSLGSPCAWSLIGVAPCAL